MAISLDARPSRAALRSRSHHLSPGAIAGAVIGSVLGATVVFLILGFVYFRYKRKAREAHAGEAPPVPKDSDFDRDVENNHGQGVFPSQQQARTPVATQPPFSSSHGDPGSGHPPQPGQHAPSTPLAQPPGNQWVGRQALQDGVYDALPLQDIVSSQSGRQQTFPAAADRTSCSPLDHASTAPAAANSTYYDMRISMDSDPAQAITPPTRQMSDLYEVQKKQAEDYSRQNSLRRQLWNMVTGRRSTHDSSKTQSDQNVQVKSEPVLEEGGVGGVDWPPQFYEEPSQMSSSPITPDLYSRQRQQSQYGQNRPTPGSQYGESAGILGSIEKDPDLPSSYMRTDSTSNWLPPNPRIETQPQSSSTPERLKSPDIPEFMNVEGIPPEDDAHSPFRQPTKSPRLPPQATVNPMAAFVPTNAVEKAAYNTYQIEHSASPPAMPSSPPEIITQQPTQEDTIMSPPPTEDDLDMYLDLPDDDDNRRSSDSYDYPMTPGQSSTGYSSGRTPDTRPTASPSPFSTIVEHQAVKPEPHMLSPEDPKTSNLATVHTCSECHRSFDQIHKLNHHKRYHDRTHECPYAGCDRKFGTKTHLDRHINDRHLKSRAYHCTDPSCPYFKGGKSFPRKDNWRRHMMKKHGTTPQDFATIEAMAMAMDVS